MNPTIEVTKSDERQVLTVEGVEISYELIRQFVSTRFVSKHVMLNGQPGDDFTITEIREE